MECLTVDMRVETALTDEVQIDFVALSSELDGTGYRAREGDIQGNPVLSKGADHRPILAHIRIERPLPKLAPRPCLSVKGWAPSDERARATFRHKTTEVGSLQSNLLQVETRLLDIATSGFYSTPALLRSAAAGEYRNKARASQCATLSTAHQKSGKLAFKRRRAVQKESDKMSAARI